MGLLASCAQRGEYVWVDEVDEPLVRYDTFVTDPSVTASASVEETRPLTVSVMGEVARPGVYVVDSTAGVLNALAAAGGLTQYAREDRIFVLRQQRGSMEPVRIRFDYRLLSCAEGKTTHFHLQRDDIVVAE